MNNLYLKAYGLFKKLPFIFAGFILVTCVILGFVDAFECITELGDAFDIGAIFVWGVIGGVSAAIIGGLTMIFISPTVLRTDATLGINE